MSTCKFVTEIEKSNSQIWVTIHENSYHLFTQQEVDEIIVPYKQFVQTLDGLLIEENSWEFLNENKLKLTTVFDSKENALNGILKMSKDSDVDIVISKNLLLKNKYEELEINYTVKKYLEFTDGSRIIIR
jgi:hypothetical protein